MTKATVTPSMYCRKCRYVLDGLSHDDVRRCPECGWPFDPGNPKTYRTKPRRQWRFSIVLSILLVLAFAGSGWLYLHRHIANKRAVFARQTYLKKTLRQRISVLQNELSKRQRDPHLAQELRNKIAEYKVTLSSLDAPQSGD